MTILDMVIKISPCSACIVTMWTFEWFFSRVGSIVLLQITGSDCSIFTLVTFVRSFTSMTSNMDDKTLVTFCLIVTALMWTFLVCPTMDIAFMC